MTLDQPVTVGHLEAACRILTRTLARSERLGQGELLVVHVLLDELEAARTLLRGQCWAEDALRLLMHRLSTQSEAWAMSLLGRAVVLKAGIG